MVDHGKTRSTVKPETIVIDDYSVWEHTNIKDVSENVGEEKFVGFEFDMKQYSKEEFILKQAQEKDVLEQQLEDAEMALCELYEMIDQGE